MEETAVAAYWVTDGVDRCLVGFLPRHCVQHRAHYEGRVAQIVEFLSCSESTLQQRQSHLNKGVCMAAFLQK